MHFFLKSKYLVVDFKVAVPEIKRKFYFVNIFTSLLGI